MPTRRPRVLLTALEQEKGRRLSLMDPDPDTKIARKGLMNATDNFPVCGPHSWEFFLNKIITVCWIVISF